MAIFGFFGGTNNATQNELQNIFPLSLIQSEFTYSDIFSTYVKILTDTADRTHGLTEESEAALWDNFVFDSSTNGLISFLAKAMTDKSDLFLTYKLKVLREADQNEKTQIEADYKLSGKSSVGVWVSFKCYKRTDMLKIYSALEYCVLASLHKTVNISKAVQIKISDLRSGIGLQDSQIAISQAKSIATALANGKDVLLDAKDSVVNATPDISPTEKAISFLDSKRAFVLALPVSYVTGVQTSSIGSTGEQDMRSVERGLKQYFETILKPTCKALFGPTVEFKSQDFRQMTTAMEVLKTFDLVSDDSLSRQSKQEITARLFDLDLAEEQKNIVKEEKERAAEAQKDQPVDNAFAINNSGNKNS